MSQAAERQLDLSEFRALSNAIATYEDFNLLVRRLVEGICRTFTIKGASIMLLDEKEGRLFRVSSCGISETYLNKGPVFVDSCYCCLGSGKVEIVQDLQNDERIQYPEAARKEGLASLLAIPVKYKTTAVGVIRLYHTEQMQICEEDIDSLCALGSQLGVVIENNNLYNFLEQIKKAVESLPPHMLHA
ncbi:MAG TPA: GAF domain-containing protein [Desulfosalsimonadaceae bacterium]|nr:GAF domain-containing protein [Desulfosalsimonadaceae bacterium]